MHDMLIALKNGMQLFNVSCSGGCVCGFDRVITATGSESDKQAQRISFAEAAKGKYYRQIIEWFL
jgi:hypothetical protein